MTDLISSTEKHCNYALSNARSLMVGDTNRVLLVTQSPSIQLGRNTSDVKICNDQTLWFRVATPTSVNEEVEECLINYFRVFLKLDCRIERGYLSYMTGVTTTYLTFYNICEDVTRVLLVNPRNIRHESPYLDDINAFKKEGYSSVQEPKEKVTSGSPHATHVGAIVYYMAMTLVLFIYLTRIFGLW